MSHSRGNQFLGLPGKFFVFWDAVPYGGFLSKKKPQRFLSGAGVFYFYAELKNHQHIEGNIFLQGNFLQTYPRDQGKH